MATRVFVGILAPEMAYVTYKNLYFDFDFCFQKLFYLWECSVQHRQEIGGDICLTTLKTKETFVL